MLTSDMECVMERLSSDWLFIEEFLNNPEEALKGFNLSEEERRCLQARDPNQLFALGVGEDQVEIVLSGRHTPVCKTVPE